MLWNIKQLLARFQYVLRCPTELIEFLLTKWSAKIDDKSDRQGAEDVCVQVLAQLRHAFNQLIFGRNKSMVFKMIHQILLSMFTQEVKFDLSR